MKEYPVIFVSLGPGEPELITVKGLKALQAADTVFCPEPRVKTACDSVNVSRAATILQQLGIRESHIHRFILPMSKRRSEALATYETACADILHRYREGEKVCVAAEGDAGFYSSIHYLHERLQTAGCPTEYIAGVPAFIAAGARAQLHIVRGTETLTVLPGTAGADEVTCHIAPKGAVVIMKLSKCSQNVRELFQLHPEYDYHYFENVGTPREIYLNDLTLINQQEFPYFSMLIIRRQKNSDDG